MGIFDLGMFLFTPVVASQVKVEIKWKHFPVSKWLLLNRIMNLQSLDITTIGPVQMFSSGTNNSGDHNHTLRVRLI